MTRRVLIVTSSYAPAMIADMHRARHLAWTLPGVGWEVEILSPDGGYQQASCMDADSAGFFAPGTPVHYVPQLFPSLFRVLGFGSIGWRALLPMLLAGRKLLRERRFDLVYLSTTQFPLFLLGPAWKAGTGVPYVLDIHDPCFKEDLPVWARPSLKHGASRWLMRHIESISVKFAAGLVAVSPDYLKSVRRRHGAGRPDWLGENRHAVIPFAVLERDFEVADEAGNPRSSLLAGSDIRITYVGAGGPIMHKAFELLCKALGQLRAINAEVFAGVRFELYGTMLGWREGDPTHLADIARDEGVADLVAEDPRRVTYRRSVELLLRADGALILGVDDAGYMPSKLYAYAYPDKPLLAVVRGDGPAYAQFRAMAGLGRAVAFDRADETAVADAAQVVGAFLDEAANRTRFDRRAMLDEFMAPAMALRHATLFDACLR